MPDIPENQQSIGSKPTQGPEIPVFPHTTVIEWEYDIGPVQARPATGQTDPSASPVIKPEVPVSEGKNSSAVNTGPAASEPPCRPLTEADKDSGRPPEPAGSKQSGAFYPRQAYSGMNGYAPAFSPKKKRLSIPLIVGAAVFAVIIAGLLISGLFRHHNSSVRGDTGNISSMEATASISKPQKMTEQQEVFAATLFEKLPEALASMSKNFTKDQVFLEAISQAKLTDVVFSDNQVDFSIMLPDPSAESLDQLGVSSYTPHSGARAYIQDNYAKLCNMDKMTNVVLIPATLYPQKNTDGSLIVDWSLPALAGVPYNYEQTFIPQMSKYMKDKGFYTAAMELIMPDFQSWDKHTGTEHDIAELDEYFQSLAEALAPKGITLNGKTVSDIDTIKQTLKTRFVSTWAFDSPDIQTSGYQTMFTVRTVQENWFQDVSDELDVKYETDAKSRPADLNALEAAYLINIRKKINDSFGSNGLQGNNVYNMQYTFTWQELGDKGVAACPELVDVIRQYLFSYDFQLMFTAATALGITSN